MKQQIRSGVFETNSSSVHSLTMCKDSDYSKWVGGELLYDYSQDLLVTKEFVKKELEQDKSSGSCDYFENGGTTHRFLSYDQFFNNYDALEYETFDDSFTTALGEEVHAFGYFGHD